MTIDIFFAFSPVSRLSDLFVYLSGDGKIGGKYRKRCETRKEVPSLSLVYDLGFHCGDSANFLSQNADSFIHIISLHFLLSSFWAISQGPGCLRTDIVNKFLPRLRCESRKESESLEHKYGLSEQSRACMLLDNC